jgi:hypothetical protein
MWRRHPKMLKNKCKGNLRQHSKAKALNHQRRWPIKAAERSLTVVRRRKPAATFFIRITQRKAYSVASSSAPGARNTSRNFKWQS